MAENTDRYIVTEDSELVEEEADLNNENHTWPDGRPMTEENTEAYTTERANLGGRPSLGGGGTSPQVAFRISQELRDHAEKIAEEEGRTVSAIAREALEQYVNSH